MRGKNRLTIPYDRRGYYYLLTTLSIVIRIMVNNRSTITDLISCGFAPYPIPVLYDCIVDRLGV